MRQSRQNEQAPWAPYCQAQGECSDLPLVWEMEDKRAGCQTKTLSLGEWDTGLRED